MGLRLPKFNDATEEELLRQAQEEQRQHSGGPKFEPTETSVNMTQYNDANIAPDPVFAAPQTANAPQMRPELPKFDVPEPQPNQAQFDETTTPIPVFDEHGAPTGAVHGGGSELEKRSAAARAEEAYKPENHNSRAAGAGLGAVRGLERGGIMGAIFGGVRGLVNKSADEEYAHHRRQAKADNSYAREASRVKFDDTQLNQQVDREAKIARFNLDVNQERNKVADKERDNALKNLDKYEKLDPTNPVHAAAILRARKALWDIDPQTWNAGNVQTIFDQESGTLKQRKRGEAKWEDAVDEKGQPISTKRQGQEKLPESFYQLDGQDEKTIHADAVAKAGVKDFSKTAELDQAKVDLFKNSLGLDEAGIKDAIAIGTIKLSELVKDSQKDEARRYDAAVAGAESGALKRHNLYRQAVDQTLTAPASAPVVSIATFQQKYKEFYDDYNALYKKDPKAAEAKRANFFANLRGFRLR